MSVLALLAWPSVALVKTDYCKITLKLKTFKTFISCNLTVLRMLMCSIYFLCQMNVSAVRRQNKVLVSPVLKHYLILYSLWPVPPRFDSR